MEERPVEPIAEPAPPPAAQPDFADTVAVPVAEPEQPAPPPPTPAPSFPRFTPLAAEAEPDAASIPAPVLRNDHGQDDDDIALPPVAPLERKPRAPRVYSEDDDGDFAGSPSSFAHEPPFRARRNPARMWMIAAIVFALMALGAIGAVARYGLPDWVPLARPTFAERQPDLVLEFPPNRQDRRTLPNGTEFFGASGTITNVGKQKRSVPPILIVLRDSRNRIVYSWQVIAPKQQLAPGESVTINEAVTDVPKSAKAAEIGWKPS